MNNLNSNEIEVELSQLLKNTNKIEDETDHIISKIKELKALRAEIKAAWNGVAAERFLKTTTFNIWELEAFVNCMNKLSIDYKTAYEKYVCCEQKALDIVNAIDMDF